MKKLAVSCRVLRSLGVGGWLLAVSVAMAADMARAAESVPYLDWDDANGKMTNATLPVADYELVTSETREFADGKWYVIADAVVIDNGANIKVNGSARLVLCDDASLTITNVADYNAAIDVSVSGSTTNSLAIYGQQGGSGVLLATGGGFGAGIGTAERSETAEGCGVIVINGGIVTATGGESGAGIGGGDWTDGGVVTINGGTVTATGGTHGADIGGGYGGAGGTVTINGGNVKAATIQNAPTNGANEAVWCVTVDVEKVESVEKLRVEGLDGYGMRDIYPIDGKVYLYLPNGTHLFAVNDQWYVAAVNGAATVAKNQPTAVTVTSTKQQWPWSELSIDYKCENIPDNNAHAYRIELQYRISSVDEWTTVPAEDYRRPSDWTETVDGLLVHRITNGVDRLTWDVRKTFGADVNLRDSQVRINVHDLGARWDGYDADSPQGIWPARLLDLDLVTGSVTAVQDRPHNLEELKAHAKAEMVYFYRSQHMLFREVPAGFFKRGDQYWHFGGTAYVGVFRMTGDQYTMITTSTKEGDLNLKQVSLENLRGTHAPAWGEPLPTSPLGKLNARIASSGWRIDVLPDYAYGQRLLWAGNETCPVTDSSTADEYGDFGANPAAGSKRPSDWGFYDLVSGQEWTLSTNAGNYGPFGATSASVAKIQLNSDVNCNTPETTTRAVRLVLWRMGTILVTEKVFASALDPGSYLPGVPARVWLDTRIEREIVGTNAVEISYSGDDWGRGGTGVTVWYSFEGGAAKTLKEASDSGTFEWTPRANGRYVFSHAVADGATNTAVIVVDSPPGCEINPWKVGENVTAYVSDEGVLVIGGTGAMSNFVSAADVPWAPETVKKVAVDVSKIQIGVNSLSALADGTLINETLVSNIRPYVSGFTSTPVQPAGAISPAEFERIDIVDGVAYLGVSVYTNSEVKVEGEGEGWSVATNGVIEVPAPGKRGFFILKSKPAAVSNRSGRPDTADVQHD